MTLAQPIWLAAGGTGGHIFPATSLAYQLVGNASSIAIITDRRGKKLLDSYAYSKDIAIRYIPSASPFAGTLFTRLLACLKLGVGGLVLFPQMLIQRPACVISFGGYPSFMPACIAKLLGIPVILHEQNAIMGRSNRLPAKLAKLVMTSWPDTQGLPENANILHTGLPVRNEFTSIKAYHPSPKQTVRILILGGSQGAYLFGELVAEALIDLPLSMRNNMHVTHQVRNEQHGQVKQLYADAGISATIAAFFTDVPQQMADSDLILCRAGASSVAEIATAGRAALLIPLASALDNHQLANAQCLSARHAALVVEETECTPKRLSEQIGAILASREDRVGLAQNARKSGHVNAARKMADAVLQLLRQPQEAS